MQLMYRTTEGAVVLVAKWKTPFLIAYSYVWNVCRRPFVALWKRRVVKLAWLIKQALAIDLLPSLYDNMRQGCGTCRDMYGFLKGQPFTSEIEKAVFKFHCPTHFEPYLQFYSQYESWFRESHELSDKICGFKSKRAIE